MHPRNSRGQCTARVPEHLQLHLSSLCCLPVALRAQPAWRSTPRLVRQPLPALPAVKGRTAGTNAPAEPRKTVASNHLTRQELRMGTAGQVPSQRLRMTVAYDGGAFAGFQLQAGKTRTVQGELEKAASKVFLGCSRTVGASRTDAGAHALGQVVHFDILGSRDSLETDMMFLNAALPVDVKVVGLAYAEAGFDAHFSAVAKTYHYRITAGAPNPLEANRSWWTHARHVENARGPPLTSAALELDVVAMQEAGRQLLGTHDFTALTDTRRAPGRGAVMRKRPGLTKTEGVVADRQRSQNIRTLGELRVSESRDSLSSAQTVEVVVTGDGFLYHMVRVFLAALVEVGAGRLSAAQLVRAVEAGDRSVLPEAAPPHGLYLARVWYMTDMEELLSRCEGQSGAALQAAITRPSTPSDAEQPPAPTTGTP